MSPEPAASADRGTPPAPAPKKTPTKQGQPPRPHFRIEWRHLSYHARPQTYLSDICAGGGAKEGAHQQQAGPALKAGPQIGEKDYRRPSRILNSLDGCFRSGELSAILGPSGAGKSTFLSVLFGTKHDGASGVTRVRWLPTAAANGPGETAGSGPPTGAPTKLRRSLKVACLPQQDHLLHHLSVYETLMFASLIKNATGASASRKDKHFHRQNVRRIAKMLKLTDCLGTRCGKLSGGQYKRVSIGQELLSEPDVIILDEPTSGLDAMTCLTTVQTLQSIVKRAHPMSIILTIHQPDLDVFSLFDKVYVIAQGGRAIYEGPPNDILATLARVGLKPPAGCYNPARFIVELAFLAGLEEARGTGAAEPAGPGETVLSEAEDEEEEEGAESEPPPEDASKKGSLLRRSLASLTALGSLKDLPSMVSASPAGQAGPFGWRNQTRNASGKRPLLNIGFRTLDGQLISGRELLETGKAGEDSTAARYAERRRLLRRLNAIQRERYLREPLACDTADRAHPHRTTDTCLGQPSPDQDDIGSSKSDYSSCYALAGPGEPANLSVGKSFGSPASADEANPRQDRPAQSGVRTNSTPTSDRESVFSESDFVVDFQEASEVAARKPATTVQPPGEPLCAPAGAGSGNGSGSDESDAESEPFPVRRRGTGFGQSLQMRQFDKRLSNRGNCLDGYPMWYHTYQIMHRTWLSIVRDPIFFGIQAAMHTTIPVLLAVIFGSRQEEGCPKVGNFDLIGFAYSDNSNVIEDTVQSIRGSIGNIGIMFFEMFVLSFSINCITALVFPLDMHVLLKEYRNGWYSMRSYLLGRTLADLPVPLLLHSLAIAILYFMTGQPAIWWRFGSIVLLVIISSLVAQSVGLTVGALLMKSSQSAVLLAAGVVAPFFALSGFIVRIHTLPIFAQMAAKASYLYYLLNGFIIVRYGFDRCSCSSEDFESNGVHPVPENVKTVASMWIGSYSEEYRNSSAMAHISANKTNIDPNIDVVDKMMDAFKMVNSYGHKISDCNDVLPYAMLDFELRDSDIYICFWALLLMLLISRFITFTAIYYKVRAVA